MESGGDECEWEDASFYLHFQIVSRGVFWRWLCPNSLHEQVQGEEQEQVDKPQQDYENLEQHSTAAANQQPHTIKQAPNHQSSQTLEQQHYPPPKTPVTLEYLQAQQNGPKIQLEIILHPSQTQP